MFQVNIPIEYYDRHCPLTWVYLKYTFGKLDSLPTPDDGVWGEDPSQVGILGVGLNQWAQRLRLAPSDKPN